MIKVSTYLPTDNIEMTLNRFFQEEHLCASSFRNIHRYHEGETILPPAK